ncbi:MAG: M1 family metallopeptidase [Armatimonadetes bacterium]|nr:M1 family metallopeptidase [Armatimonadota bacterium]
MRPVALVTLALLSCSVMADGYKRQPGIDITNYEFRLTLSDETDRIEGLAEISLRIVQSGVEGIWLDLKSKVGDKGMVVEAVSCSASPVTYTHVDDRLLIKFAVEPSINQSMHVLVKYAGVPTGGLWIGDNKHGDRGFFSLNWPNRAREWLPMIDHPYDKATHEFIVTAPAHYQVVSGGLLVEETDNDDGTTTTHWKQSVPIASWLTALAVSRFSVRNFDDYEGVQLSTWVFPQDRAKGVATFEVPVARAVRFFSESIGEFPYEKLANIQAAGFGGGTELASAIFYGQDSVTDRAATGLVVHEIAHQWWGNSVTENDWNDVWLSEGFATYFTLLYIEQYEGREAFVEGLKRARDRVYEMEADNPNRPVVHADLQDMSLVTSGIQYQKGAWVLHMLREKIGTEVFWRGIRKYYAKYRDKNASTDDFRRVMEEVSGSNLERFFDKWLTRGVSPEIEIDWHYDDEKQIIVLEVKQIQDGPVHDLDLKIRLMNRSGQTRDHYIWASPRRTYTFKLPSNGNEEIVAIDPETQTLLRWKIEIRDSSAIETKSNDRAVVLGIRALPSSPAVVGHVAPV